jgi:hypothetical protein
VRINNIKTHQFNLNNFIIGDSRLRNLNLENYQNLSIAGIGMPEIYFITKTLIENSQSINSIIYCVDPDHLFKYNHFETLQRDNPLTQLQNSQILDEGLLFKDSLYQLKQKKYIDAIIFRLLIMEIGQRIKQPGYIIKDFKDEIDNSDNYPCHESKLIIPRVVDNQQWNSTNFSELNHLYSIRLFKLLDQNNIKLVYWVVPDQKYGYNKLFKNWYIQNLHNRGGKYVKWIDIGPSFSEEDFYDNKHFNCSGLSKLKSIIQTHICPK